MKSSGRGAIALAFAGAFMFWIADPVFDAWIVGGKSFFESLLLPSGEEVLERSIVSMLFLGIGILLRRSVIHQQRAEQGLTAALMEAKEGERLALLAGGVAHDFNNLLTVIAGNAGLALMDDELSASSRECFDDIEKTALRGQEVTSQLMAYAGHIELQIRPTDISGVINETRALAEATASANAVIEWELSPNIPDVMADDFQLRQILLNLIHNASEAIGDQPGTITVLTETAESNGDGWAAALSVCDNGPRMDAETKEKVFEPFFTTKFPGRGLGLASVKGIIDSLGGEISVTSALGEGTTFRVVLPAATTS